MSELIHAEVVKLRNWERLSCGESYDGGGWVSEKFAFTFNLVLKKYHPYIHRSLNRQPSGTKQQINFRYNFIHCACAHEWAKKYSEVVLYDRSIIGTSSEIFGYLLTIFGKCSEKCSETFSKPSEQFWKIFGNLRKVVGNLRKVKTSLLVCLYNKQNNTWTLGDMEFIFECSHWYFCAVFSKRTIYTVT